MARREHAGDLWTGLSPEGAALGTNNQMVRASDWGDMSETFNGAGGVATGAVAVNECFVVDNPMQARDGYCSYAPAWSDRTQYKLNGSVPLPYDMAFSFVFQSIPGERRFSDYAVARQIDFVEQQLGHDLLETGMTVPLFPSGIGFWTDARGGTLTTSRYIDNSVQYEPQLNQFDVRLTKILRFGGGLIRANFDVFNIFNSSNVTRVIDTYSEPGEFPRVAGIMNGRLFKFGATIDW